MAVALKDVRIDLRANIQQKSTLEKAAELRTCLKSSIVANLDWLNGIIFIYFRSFPINET